VASSPKAVVPKGARVIDGKGKYLIPGLWDMHVHLWDRQPMLNLYLAAGVTGIRDMGSDPTRTLALRRDIEAGKIPGPRIVTSGPLVDGPGSGITQAPVIQAENANEGRAAADTIDDAGHDFIKVLSRLSVDAYQALAQRARVRRAIFAGHVPESVSVWEAVDARQKSQEHLFGMALACSYDETRLRRQRLEAIAKKDYEALRDIRDRTYATFSASQCRELFRKMARYGVWQTPTLTLRKRLSLMDLERLAAETQLRLVPNDVRSGWKDPREDLKRATPEQLKNFTEDYEFHRNLTVMMQRAGVGLLAGTDTGDSYVVPGFSLHDELEYLVEAGLTPLEALNTATINAARYLDREKTEGTVERGKRADLVLLDADPLADIRNTRKIALVIVNGRLTSEPAAAKPHETARPKPRKGPATSRRPASAP
jgi:imidazolonepropionase-like amidohydrolase